MDRKELNRLLDRSKNGSISEEEATKLDIWYNSFEYLDDYTEGMRIEDQDALGSSLLSTIQKEIQITGNTCKGLKGTKIGVEVMGLTVLIILLFISRVEKIEYHTDLGEVMNLELPDGSQVILNGNSRLAYQEEWLMEFDRTVYLEGEAFFHVLPIDGDELFKVDQGEGLLVEVHGTEFNVHNRKGMQTVALKSGSIQLVRTSSVSNENSINFMEPGEVAQYEIGKDKLRVSIVENPASFYSWIDGRLILDHSSLEEIIGTLKDSHELDILLENAHLKEKRASGTLPLSPNSGEMMENLAALFGVEIVNRGKQIHMQ